MRDFSTQLRSLRKARRLSQIDLAAEAFVSSRHLAFLETGRSRPSREMVLRLARTLDLAPCDQNTLLDAAGFSAEYPSLPLQSDEMAQVRLAMDWMIERHSPHPALILDRVWQIVAMNGPATALLSQAGLNIGDSLLRFVLDEGLFRQHVENWEEVGHHLMRRLKSESAKVGGIAALDRAVAKLAAIPEIAGHEPVVTGRAVVPTIYRAGSEKLSLFSTLARFGAAEEVTTADLQIELMFPADEATKTKLETLFGQGMPPSTAKLTE